MPTKIEKDAISGRETTGHEWDGLKELNTPLPKWWIYVFFACIAWAIVWFVLYPSWPLGTTHTKGILGYSSRKSVDADVAQLVDQRKVSMDRIGSMSFDAIKADPALMEVAMTSGRITFAENCQPCHGAGGSGNPGYPALAAGAWIWGGKLADIQQTVAHGIRAGDTDGRPAIAMPKFSDSLKPDQIQSVAGFVNAKFYGHDTGKDTKAGAALFADNCASCHGEKGEGNRDMGAPKLASRVHLYGDTLDAIVSQVSAPKLGVMPNWGTRLSPATIKAVSLYVHAMGGGE